MNFIERQEAEQAEIEYDRNIYQMQKTMAERQIEIDELKLEENCRQKWKTSRSIRETYFSLDGFIADKLQDHQQRLADEVRFKRRVMLRQ